MFNFSSEIQQQPLHIPTNNDHFPSLNLMPLRPELTSPSTGIKQAFIAYAISVESHSNTPAFLPFFVFLLKTGTPV